MFSIFSKKKIINLSHNCKLILLVKNIIILSSIIFECIKNLISKWKTFNPLASPSEGPLHLNMEM